MTTTLVHGGRYVGVYLAAAPFGSPELDAAVEQLAAFGIQTSASSIACDAGAARRLGVPNDGGAVAIYFEHKADAEAWAEALDPPPLGIVAVRTYCAD